MGCAHRDLQSPLLVLGFAAVSTCAHTPTGRHTHVCILTLHPACVHRPRGTLGEPPTAVPNRPSHCLPQKTPSRPASAQALGTGTQSLACPSDPSPPGPQVPPAEPRELEEVLVVVGGRALEDEEAAEGPVPHPGNFAFYDTRASEYSPRPSSGPCPCVLTSPRVSRAGGGSEVHGERGHSWGAWASRGGRWPGATAERGAQSGGTAAPPPPATACSLVFKLPGPCKEFRGQPAPRGSGAWPAAPSWCSCPVQLGDHGPGWRAGSPGGRQLGF